MVFDNQEELLPSQLNDTPFHFQTPEGHCDHKLIEESINTIEDIIKAVDAKAGESKCKFTKEKLDYLEDGQKNILIEESSAVLCDGILKNNRGTVSSVL